MAERPSHADLIQRWVDAHRAELEEIVYGQVTFVFTNGSPPRVRVERSEQIQESGARLSA